mgnify:CR=1 FL=1
MNSNEPSSTTIQTIDDLVTALSEGERTTYNHIIHSIKFSKNAFEKYASWSDDCYTRNCIANNEKFELILICWCEGHRTAIHDHGGEECWVKVIDGEFKETEKHTYLINQKFLAKKFRWHFEKGLIDLYEKKEIDPNNDHQSPG